MIISSRIFRKLFVSITVGYAIFSSPVTFSESLILTAAPRETAQQGLQTYGGLAGYISKVLGRRVEYYNAGYWIRYQGDIKKKKYDIVMDGPHLASWRIKNVGHTPLVKLPGHLQFHILARAEDSNIKDIENLIFRKVCVIPPPNLTAIVLYEELNDPIREPVTVGVKGGMRKLYDKLLNRGCDGAVVRTSFYNKLSEEDRARVKIIYTSMKLPNQVITVSDRISADEREKLIAALTSEQSSQAVAPIMKRFGGKNTKLFVPVEPDEYKGYSSLLEGVVLGW